MPISKEMRARYPADWGLRSRFVRFVRAKGRCEWCGVRQYAIVKRANGKPVAEPSTYAEAKQELAERYASLFGIEGDAPCPWSIVVLTTAHVFRQEPEAADLLNLAALCQRCHNRHDAAMRVQHRREKRWESQLGLAF